MYTYLFSDFQFLATNHRNIRPCFARFQWGALPSQLPVNPGHLEDAFLSSQLIKGDFRDLTLAKVDSFQVDLSHPAIEHFMVVGNQVVRAMSDSKLGIRWD